MQLVLCGPAVGKSSLVRKMQTDKFVECTPSLGIELNILSHNDTTYQIWTLPSNDAYYSPSLLPKAQGLILLLDNDTCNDLFTWLGKINTWYPELKPEQVKVVLTKGELPLGKGDSAVRNAFIKAVSLRHFQIVSAKAVPSRLLCSVLLDSFKSKKEPEGKIEVKKEPEGKIEVKKPKRVSLRVSNREACGLPSKATLAESKPVGASEGDDARIKQFVPPRSLFCDIPSCELCVETPPTGKTRSIDDIANNLIRMVEQFSKEFK